MALVELYLEVLLEFILVFLMYKSNSSPSKGPGIVQWDEGNIL